MDSLSERPASLADVVRRQAGGRADSPALSFAGTTWTYGELDTRSSRTANALIEAGVTPGDRVAILARNAPVFFDLAFGAAKAGAQLVGLNWRLAAPEIAAILGDAQPRLVLVADEFVPLLAGVERTSATAVSSLEAFAAAVDGASETDPRRDGAPGDVCSMLYTSGTTGLPKGVQLTHENMSYTAWISEHGYAMGADSVNLVAMPLFHVGGLGYGLSAFMHGGHTVLLTDPDPAAVVRAIGQYRVTHAFFVPAVIQSILASDAVAGSNLTSLELLVYGAAPISDALLREAISVLGCRFVQAYGMTETAGTIVVLPADDHDPDGPHPERLRACGRALPWIELRIVDPATGDDVATGAVGEIWTRSPQNTIGYRNRPEETAAAILPDGWLRTGDAAYRDADDYIYLFDRFKDMIVSGAENVYPAEVENVLHAHPGVHEVAVIGVPHEKWGETVKAIVVRADGNPVTAAELIEFARGQLARYKCPTSVDFVDSLPRNASGKLLKHELRAPFWKGQQRMIS